MSQEGGLAGTPACRHPALTSSLRTEAQPLPFPPPVLAAAAAAALRPGPGRLRVRPAKRRANSAATGSTAPRRAPARSRTTTWKPDAARAVPDTDTGGRCRPRGAPASAVRCREMYQRGRWARDPGDTCAASSGPAVARDTRPAPSHRQGTAPAGTWCPPAFPWLNPSIMWAEEGGSQRRGDARAGPWCQGRLLCPGAQRFRCCRGQSKATDCGGTEVGGTQGSSRAGGEGPGARREGAEGFVPGGG